MKKQILSEVNRTREIMGLGKLILSEGRAYKYNENGTVITGGKDYIESRLEKKYKITSFGQLEGYGDLNTILGKRNFPGYNPSFIHAEDVVVAFVQELGGGKITNRGIAKFMEAMNNGGFNIDVKSESIPAFDKDGITYVLTQGQITGTDVREEKRNAKSTVGRMAKYLNAYNINSFANEGAQYDITEMGSKSLDFSTGPGGRDGALLLYASKTGAKQGVEQEDQVDTEVEKGYQATGRYQTDYAAGDSNPDSSIVDKAVMEISQMFPADIAKDIDVFNLQAGASANWGGNKLPNSQGKGNSGFAEGDEGKNQRLAFERGDKFMKAVNGKLKAKGHPGFDNYMVNWIVQGQSKSDQFIDLMLKVDKEDKIKTTTIVTGKVTGDKKIERKSGTITAVTILIGVG